MATRRPSRSTKRQTGGSDANTKQPDRVSADEGGGVVGDSGVGVDVDKAHVPPAFACALLLAVAVPAVLFVNWRLYTVPDALTVDAPDTVFSEGRARAHVEVLAGDLGYRPVGSVANERQAVNYVLQQVRDIVPLAESNGWDVEVSVQSPTGSLTFVFLDVYLVRCCAARHRFDEANTPAPQSNAYSNITNVVLRMHAGGLPEERVNRALLLSAHVDSTLGTPGAADDVVGVAVLLECARAMAAMPAALAHPVIFNINGAEESFLQASHGFVTQHKWAPTVAAFINLEGAGSGGGEILFQTGPHASWLAEIYADVVPFPHGSSVGQDIFQGGVVPGDTDFRVYRDFAAHTETHDDGLKRGSIGFDMAFYHNGDIYHTHNDDPDSVERGSIQHMGSNTLALLLAVSDSPFMMGGGNTENAVFFDVFRLYMVAYPESVATLISSLVIVFCVAMILFGGLSPGAQSGVRGACADALAGAVEGLASFLGAIFMAVGVAAVSTIVLGISMPWYANRWLLTVTYGPAAIAGALSCQSFARDKLASPASPRTFAARAVLGSSTNCVMLLAVATYYRLGSAYVLIPFAACPLLGLAASQRAARSFLGAGQWAVGVVLATLFTLSFGLYHTLELIELVVPTLGKIGSVPAIVADVVAALTVAIGSMLTVGTALPWLHQLPRKSTRALGGALFVLTVIGLVVASSSSPYSPEHPKRMIVHHLHRYAPRVLREGEAGFDQELETSALRVSPFDPNPPAYYLGAIREQNARLVAAGQRPDVDGEIAAIALPLGDAKPMGNGSDFLSFFPFSEFLKGVEFGDVPAHPRFAGGSPTAPRVTVKSDERISPPRQHGQHDIVRRLTLSVDTTIPMWSTLNVTAHGLVAWSFSKDLPEMTCRGGRTVSVDEVRNMRTESPGGGFAPHHDHVSCGHLVRHAGGEGSERWTFWLDLMDESEVLVSFATVMVHPHVAAGTGEPPSPAIATAIAAGDIGGGVPGAWRSTAGMGTALRSAVASIPAWVSPTVSAGTLQHFVIP